MPYFCYILECADGTYYTGWTTDPVRRERQHNRGVGAKYTRTHGPVRLVYVEPQTDRIAAMRRELKIKKLSHAQKKALSENIVEFTPAPPLLPCGSAKREGRGE